MIDGLLLLKLADEEARKANREIECIELSPANIKRLEGIELFDDVPVKECATLHNGAYKVVWKGGGAKKTMGLVWSQKREK